MSTVKGKSERENFYLDNYKLVLVFGAHKKCIGFFSSPGLNAMKSN